MAAVSISNKLFGNLSDLTVVAVTVVILSILFVPLPKPLLDFLLIVNVSSALMVLLLTFYADKPLSFSTFPSILLITTLFRLALNVSSTRLILAEADAGHVIAAIGDFVIGGNYVVGVVVFIILVIVQYVVITNGAQRVAEVAARFTLDSMPGKQMSIDADLNMGLIDEKDARSRRDEIQQEANFYGAMDGATKFVKGDAIAGIIIIFVNIVAGLSIGISSMGMSWGDALQTYTLLTVGDGIVTQIPALIIATATGIIITRAATDSKLGTEVVAQVTAHPITLAVVGVCLAAAMLLPGLPTMPLLIALMAVAALGFYSYRQLSRAQAAAMDENSALSEQQDSAAANDLEMSIEVKPIEVRLGPAINLLEETSKTLLHEKIQKVRKQYAVDTGLILPAVAIINDASQSDASGYSIHIYGVNYGSGQLFTDRVLAISGPTTKVELTGTKTREPTYGLPAVWISKEQSMDARATGYTVVEPTTVLITHLTDLLKRQGHELLTRSETQKLLDRHRSTCGGLIEEIIPQLLSMTDVQRVLQRLVREQVPIKNIEFILEVLADKGKHKKNHDELVEEVRKRIGALICQNLANKASELEVMTLDPQAERILINAINPPERMNPFSLDAQGYDRLVQAISATSQRMMSKGKVPILLCSPVLRPKIKQLMERVLPRLAVLGLTEVPNTVVVKSFETVHVILTKEMTEVTAHG